MSNEKTKPPGAGFGAGHTGQYITLAEGLRQAAEAMEADLAYLEKKGLTTSLASLRFEAHRLARKRNAFLPTLLIIDSPMKNISERTNNPQFVGFNEMLYELAQGELAGTQFIVIDKEYFPPDETEPDWLLVRRMTPDDPAAPPLLKRHIGGPR